MIDTPEPSPKSVWAYGYEIVPPQSEERLAAIKQLLARHHAEAKKGERTWRGKLVLEELATHVLVVSDNPESDSEINRQLEAEFGQLNVKFARTAALAVENGDVE